MRQNKTSKGEIIEVEGGGRIVRSLGRKDRHSKVCTSKGLKDRRVRLAADTAIQFYDVQDRLGYDRPSKAIDWLMKEAKTAIDALNNINGPHYDHDLFTTFFKNSSAAFHRTPGERNQQASNLDGIGGFNEYPFELMSSRNKRHENPIEELVDFTWNQSYEMGDNNNREPLQSSSAMIQIQTFNNEFVDDDESFLGFDFQEENRVEEDEENGDLLVKNCGFSGSAILQYEDQQ